MEHNKDAKNKFSLSQLDPALIGIPLLIVLVLGVLFFVRPEQSTQTLNVIRGFLCNDLGFFYILLGVGVVGVSLYMAFSKYGAIRLGNTDKPQYSNFKMGCDDLYGRIRRGFDLLFVHRVGAVRGRGAH